MDAFAAAGARILSGAAVGLKFAVKWQANQEDRDEWMVG
jgi:hypothetical protein